MFQPDGIAPMGPGPRGDGHGDGWLSAAVLFAVAVIAALVLLGQDWSVRPPDNLIMQDSKRPMLMLPMPR